MRTFLIVLIGIVGGYLITSGIYNEWAFLAELEPKEVVSRLAMFGWIAILFSFLAWAVFTGLFEWWD